MFWRGWFPTQCCPVWFLFPLIFLVRAPWTGMIRCSGRFVRTCSMWYSCIYLLLSHHLPDNCIAQIPGDCRAVMTLLALIRVPAAIPAWGCMMISPSSGTRPFLLKYYFPFCAAVRRIGVMNSGWRTSLTFSPSRLLLLYLCLQKLQYPMWCLKLLLF